MLSPESEPKFYSSLSAFAVMHEEMFLLTTAGRLVGMDFLNVIFQYFFYRLSMASIGDGVIQLFTIFHITFVVLLVLSWYMSL